MVGQSFAPRAFPVKRRDWPIVILSLILLGAILASLGFGEMGFSPREVLLALAGKGEELTRTVIWDVRLPRTLVGLAAGAGLAASGPVWPKPDTAP